jgi:hypothetical protein
VHTCALYRFVQVTVGHEDSGENAPFRDEDVGESGVLIVAKNPRESGGHKAETSGRSGTLGAAQRSRLPREDSGESPGPCSRVHDARTRRWRFARVLSPQRLREMKHTSALLRRGRHAHRKTVDIPVQNDNCPQRFRGRLAKNQGSATKIQGNGTQIQGGLAKNQGEKIS